MTAPTIPAAIRISLNAAPPAVGVDSSTVIALSSRKSSATRVPVTRCHTKAIGPEAPRHRPGPARMSVMEQIRVELPEVSLAALTWGTGTAGAERRPLAVLLHGFPDT